MLLRSYYIFLRKLLYFCLVNEDVLQVVLSCICHCKIMMAIFILLTPMCCISTVPIHHWKGNLSPLFNFFSFFLQYSCSLLGNRWQAERLQCPTVRNVSCGEGWQESPLSQNKIFPFVRHDYFEPLEEHFIISLFFYHAEKCHILLLIFIELYQV